MQATPLERLIGKSRGTPFTVRKEKNGNICLYLRDVDGKERPFWEEKNTEEGCRKLGDLMLAFMLGSEWRRQLDRKSGERK